MSTETYRGIKIFILPSYVGLHYLLKRVLITDSNIIFLSSNKSLIKLLVSAGSRVIEIPAVRNDYSRKALRQIQSENELIASQFKNCTAFHFFYRNDMAALSLIGMLSKRNRSIYIPLDPEAKRVPLLHLLKSVRDFRKFGISQVAYRFIFGFTPSIFECDNSYFLGRKSKPAQENPDTEDASIFDRNRQLLLQNTDLSSIDVLYIDNASVHFPDAAAQIVSILKRLESSGFKITVKPHPKFKPLESFKFFDVILDEIPAEVCMTFAKFVLGFSSTALKAPVNAPVISLLKMVDVELKSVERYLKHLNSAKIYYPQSMNELNKIFEHNSSSQ